MTHHKLHWDHELIGTSARRSSVLFPCVTPLVAPWPATYSLLPLRGNRDKKLTKAGETPAALNSAAVGGLAMVRMAIS